MKQLNDVTLTIKDIYASVPIMAIAGSNMKVIDEALFGPLNTSVRWETIRYMVWLKHGNKIVTNNNFMDRFTRCHFNAFMRLASTLEKSKLFKDLYTDDIKLLSDGVTSRVGNKERTVDATEGRELTGSRLSKLVADRSSAITGSDTVVKNATNTKTLDTEKNVKTDEDTNASKTGLVASTSETDNKRADGPNVSTADLLTNYLTSQDKNATDTSTSTTENISNILDGNSKETNTGTEVDTLVDSTVDTKDTLVTDALDDTTTDTVNDTTAITKNDTITDVEDDVITLSGSRIDKLIALVNSDLDIASAWDTYLNAYRVIFLPTLEVIA